MQRFKEVSITQQIGNATSFIELPDCLIELTRPYNDMQDALIVNREDYHSYVHGVKMSLAPSPSYWHGFILYDEEGFSMHKGVMELSSGATYEMALSWIFDDGVGPGILERVGSVIKVNQFDKSFKNIVTKGV